MNCRDRQEGIALVVVVIAMLLLAALGAAVSLITSVDILIAANFRTGHEAFYAADAVLNWAMVDLQGVSDWNGVLSGAVRSSLADGPPSGIRLLADGTRVDLTQIVNMANCQKLAACTGSDMDARTGERPWGVNNPRWVLYAYGSLTDIDPGGLVGSPYYVMVLVGDDPSETDGDPAVDGASSAVAENPGLGILGLRAEAFGPRGAHKVVEATIARYGEAVPDAPGGGPWRVRMLSWREVR